MSEYSDQIQPGDKLVNGRKLWLQAFDSVLARSENIRAFAAAIQNRIDTDPLTVWDRDVKPLLPKQAEESGEAVQELTIQFIPKKTEQT